MHPWPQNLPGKPQALRSYLSSEMLAQLQKGGRFDYELSIRTHSLPMSSHFACESARTNSVSTGKAQTVLTLEIAHLESIQLPILYFHQNF